MTERIASTSESCLVLITRSLHRAGRLVRTWSRVARAIVSPAVPVLLLTTGCTPNDQEVNSFIHAWEASVSAPDYRVQPPDSVAISSSTAPEIDGTSSVIRQDGKITLCLVGDVKVAGMTPVEISRKIESLLEQYYVDPQVSAFGQIVSAVRIRAKKIDPPAKGAAPARELGDEA